MLDDLSAAERLGELERDNKRLRRLLDQRDAPAELRHRTRSTLSVLRAIITKSAETERDLENYVAHLHDRVSALGRAQAAIDDNGAIDLRKLVDEELRMYEASSGSRISIEGLDIELSPKVGMLVALSIHELTVNSVEHGALGSSPVGQVKVCWARSPDGALILTWQERDTRPVGEPVSKGFGTEVLTRMLPYELKADVSLSFDHSEVHCRIRLPANTILQS